ncbi:LOW QUALITY PROTEIN: 40S ribosomal protein S17-like [Lynx canadensis]|nr:LOW QUALITY PROTEIN: 40S ribosomal protein S17-like [Lynx canadensis]
MALPWAKKFISVCPRIRCACSPGGEKEICWLSWTTGAAASPVFYHLFQTPRNHFPFTRPCQHGCVCSKTAKKVARSSLRERYCTLPGSNCRANQHTCEEIAIISPGEKLLSKGAGCVTHLMRPLQRGPVRGISVKLQEEERERRDNYGPEVSALDQEITEVDPDTKEMLKPSGFAILSKLQVTQPPVGMNFKTLHGVV